MTTPPSARADGESQESRQKALVLIRPGGAEPPLFCVHARAGNLRLFRDLVQHLDPSRPVYGLQAVVRDDPPHAPYANFAQMAGRYVLEIREQQPHGPYLIAGECDGGELAYELAQQLRLAGEDVELLGLIDSFGPGGPRLRRFVPMRAFTLVDRVRMLGFHLLTLRRLDGAARTQYVSTRAARFRDTLRARASNRRGAPSIETLRQHAFQAALDAYEAAPYGGRVVLFRGARLPWGTAPARHLGWGEFVSDLEVTELPSYLGTTMLEPGVRLLAKSLGRSMDGSAAVTER